MQCTFVAPGNIQVMFRYLPNLQSKHTHTHTHTQDTVTQLTMECDQLRSELSLAKAAAEAAPQGGGTAGDSAGGGGGGGENSAGMAELESAVEARTRELSEATEK